MLFIKHRATKEEKIVGLIFLVALFLPHSSNALLLVNPLMALFLYLKNDQKVNFKSLQSTKNIFIFIVFISLLINSLSIHDLFKSFASSFNLCFMLFLFPFYTKVRIRNIFLYIAIFYILLSQLCYIFHISPVISFFDRYYPISDDYMNKYEHMVNNVEYGRNVLGFRFGGMYHNSNHLAKYLNIVLAVFLVENRKIKSLNTYIFLFLSIIIILLTGSRTGLIVMSSLILLWVYTNKNISQATRTLILSAFILIGLYIASGELEFRGLKVSEGMNDSAGTKFSTLLHYLKQDTSPIGILFGNFDITTFSSTSSPLEKFDAEYGYIIYNYGFVGFSIYALIWISIYKHLPKENKFTILLLFWMVSSTILLAYRSTFVVLIAFSRFIDPNFALPNKIQNEGRSN